MRTREASVATLVLCLAVLATLPSCARTTITSMPDPTVRGRQYSKILVFAPFADLGLRREAELAFHRKFAERGVACLAAHQLFFPGRQYSDEETLGLIRGNKIDALLFVGVTGAGTSSAYVPKTTVTTGSAQGSAWISGNWLAGSATGTSTTTSYGGYNMHLPWANFVSHLLDASDGRVVWMATASTGGNALASNATLLRSMAAKTVGQLGKDRIVR